MQEFMLLIRNEGGKTATLPPDQHQRFLNECQTYIGGLMKDGKLKSAQPLVREGKIISNSQGSWKDGPFNESNEIIVGYYHILANDIDEAISIAKRNPEFSYKASAKIEVRPIKSMEESTGFVYPKK